MERTQISLTPEQLRQLRQLARRRRTSMAALIRAAIDRVYGAEPSRDAAWDRALRFVGAFRSGRHDVSEEHDAHLAEVFRE